MKLSVWKPFDETRPGAWLLGGMTTLLAALLGFHRSTDYSLVMVGFSLVAAGISAGVAMSYVRRPKWLPVGSLSMWLGAIVLMTLSPKLALSADEKHLFIAGSVLLFSLAFRGRLLFFAPLPLAGLYLGLRDLDLRPSELFLSSSALGFILSFPLSALIMMIRSSRADSNGVVARLKELADASQEIHSRMQNEAETLLDLRESLLGTVASGASAGPGDEWASTGTATSNSGIAVCDIAKQPSLSFENLISEVRHIFVEFQKQGRSLGKISGPVRFVFFPPVAGFDEKSEIAVEIGELRTGLWDCLQLAYESLPETRALRRDGVIRLSMRHGFRVIEIAVEDNGRGIQTKSLDDQHGLQRLKSEVEARGGRFDRVARLGVGSRTSMELRILSEKPTNGRYRATIGHPFTVAESVAESVHPVIPVGLISKEASPSGGGQLA